MPRRARTPRLLVWPLLLVLAVTPAWAGHKDGERIEITGLVTDPSGRPLPQLSVVLEASRGGFSVTQFKRTKKDPTRLLARTNDRGEFSLVWPWNRFYNNFELLVGVSVRRADGEHLKVLARVDLSQRMKRDNPVVSAVAVTDVLFVENLRAFLASIESEDQRQVHQELGEPDKVERVEHPTSTRGPAWAEVSWWYFEAGKLYRFTAGKLTQIESFQPVKDF